MPSHTSTCSHLPSNCAKSHLNALIHSWQEVQQVRGRFFLSRFVLATRTTRKKKTSCVIIIVRWRDSARAHITNTHTHTHTHTHTANTREVNARVWPHTQQYYHHIPKHTETTTLSPHTVTTPIFSLHSSNIVATTNIITTHHIYRLFQQADGGCHGIPDPNGGGW